MDKNNEFNQSAGGYCTQMNITGDNFVMNGCFFDFSNDDGGHQQNSILDAGGVRFPTPAAGTTTVAAAVEKVQPSFGIGDFGGDFAAYDNTHFSSQLCVPQDDLAELELSTILAEDSYSFTNEELEKLQLIKGMSSSSTSTGPARPDTHRQRSSADWASSLMQQPATTSGAVVRDPAEPKPTRRKVVRENSEGRKCTHCSADSTPQWRSGPAGPKTLCNACGVRYKSGRLVPEYRPMASPTYVPTKHSNSHRKVLELRRQKESSLVRAHQQQQDNDDQSRHHHYYNHHHHYRHDQRHHYNGDHSNNYFDPCFLI